MATSIHGCICVGLGSVTSLVLCTIGSVEDFADCVCY